MGCLAGRGGASEQLLQAPLDFLWAPVGPLQAPGKAAAGFQVEVQQPWAAADHRAVGAGQAQDIEPPAPRTPRPLQGWARLPMRHAPQLALPPKPPRPNSSTPQSPRMSPSRGLASVRSPFRPLEPAGQAGRGKPYWLRGTEGGVLTSPCLL